MKKLSLVVALLFVGGCGLLDDATTFTVDTDWQKFTLDSDALGISVPSGSVIPAIPCGSADICAQASSQLSCSGQTYSCDLRCAQGGNCEVAVEAEIANPIDLSQDIKDNTSATAISKVSFQAMLYRVTENTLSFDTPELQLFVGPDAATSTTDPGVVKFATMPAVTAGQTPEDKIDATEEGKAALAAFVKNYTAPFKIFAKASMLFAGGAPLPQGKLTMEIDGLFEVSP